MCERLSWRLPWSCARHPSLGCHAQPHQSHPRPTSQPPGLAATPPFIEMSVLFETSLGDLVLDRCPKTGENFLKLCKTYYYNFCSLFNVQKDFIAQTGDPTDLGTGGAVDLGATSAERLSW
ncbi:hypothetical protein PTTG_27909 [Puccinia triticina 1-1 BBBD Race 1]|uniref:PPIase cyclophilin-type domain-containing protein n=1 Tax=Puccinia triticina (isolate 1-1 / race 1 (BBBD)) TaxID=630390 RepID=A0A180GH66_PUCT1|nr:hypothetical protein PTTG_27909 [Puccinia triticina 1-1 BBBD Race 1]